MKVYSPQDFLKMPVTGLVPESSGTAPSSPVLGQLWYDSGTNQLKVYLGAGPGWVQCDNVTGGTASNVTDGDKGEITVAGGIWTVDNGVITSAKIADGTIAHIDLSDAVLPVGYTTGTALPGVPALRQLGHGTLATDRAMEGNIRLDQILSPTSTVSMGSQRLISLADPTSPQDGATKAYVDAQSQGLDAKASVRAATTATINLSPATIAIDGITMGANERLLVKNQTNPAQNGIYYLNGTDWTRATDMDTWAEVPGAFVFVEEGNTQADTGWVSTADRGGTVGSTAITWTQFSSAGAYTGGNGLTLTGLDFSVNVDNVGIEIASDILRLKDGGVTSAKIADGTIVAGDLAPGTIPGSLPPSGAAGGSLTGTYPNPTLAVDSVGAAQIFANAVGSSEIVDGAVGTAELADNSVTSAKIVDNTIVVGDLAPSLRDGTAIQLQVRALGTGSSEAAPGNHTHAGMARSAMVASPALTANTWSASIPHNLGNAHPQVRVEDATTGEQVIIDNKPIDANNVALRSGLAVAMSAFNVVVEG